MTNSLVFPDKLPALAMATELLITQTGMMFTRAILKGKSQKLCIKKANPKAKTNMETTAVSTVFLTSKNLDLFISKSRAPSNTIKTNPKVPKIGSKADKSGILTSVN